MKTIRDSKIKRKRVLLRCDFNVPLDEKGNILNDFRIKASLPTIKYLIENGAKVILISHLGDPDGPDERYSLKPVSEKLEQFLNQTVGIIQELPSTNQSVGAIHELFPGRIIILENLRFHKGEKTNDNNFAKQLANLGDIYINDAFGVCHRNHASVVGVPKYLPSCAGLLLEKEIKVLSEVLENPQRPLVAIIGGVKIKTKIKVISTFLEKADWVLVGGKIAYDFNLQYTEKCSRCIGGMWKCPAARWRDISRLVLPIDNIKKLDIGPKTIQVFSEIIKKAKTIIWNGPLGKFEDKKFGRGTKEIAQAIAENNKAFKITGGGETVEAIFKYGLENKFNHISTGGGAMLAFLSGQKLPGIEVLK